MAGFTSEDLKNRKKTTTYIKEGAKLQSKISKLSSQIQINEQKLNRAKLAGNKSLVSAKQWTISLYGCKLHGLTLYYQMEGQIVNHETLDLFKKDLHSIVD